MAEEMNFFFFFKGQYDWRAVKERRSYKMRLQTVLCRHRTDEERDGDKDVSFNHV